MQKFKIFFPVTQYINGGNRRGVKIVSKTGMQRSEKQSRIKKSTLFLCCFIGFLFLLICFGVWNQLQVTEKEVEFQQHSARPTTELTMKSMQKRADEPVEIVFAGDTMFDWDLRPILKREGYDYPFEHVKETVLQADYSFINLESVITKDKTMKDPNQLFWIKSDPAALEGLKNSGFKMLNIGNNHTLDYLHSGLLDTLHYVKKYQFDYIGAGKNEKEAYRSKEIEIKGKTFRFFSFVRFYPSAAWVATDDKPGVPNGYDLSLVKKTIEEQKGDSDYLIVYFHWGVEKTNLPSRISKRICCCTEGIRSRFNCWKPSTLVTRV